MIAMPEHGYLRNALERTTLLVAGGRRDKAEVAVLLRELAHASKGAESPSIVMRVRRPG